jgi:flagellar FliL protein
MAENAAEKEQDAPAPAASPGKEKSKNSPILMGLILLNTIVMLAVGYFIYAEKMQALKTPTMEPIEAGAALDQKEGTLEPTSGFAVPLDYFLVNLAEDQGQKLFKVQMEFDVDSVEVQEEINKRMPQVRDIIIILLSSKTYNQIATPKGKERLKEEIRDTVNSFLTKGKINKVLFTEFINS